MTELLSIVTVVHEPYTSYLPDVYASIVQQDMPAGWEWEWLVRGSGVSASVLEPLPHDSRINFGQDPAMGPSVSRNVAMGYARGKILRNLDVDDLLLPGGLWRDIEALDLDPLIGWCVSGGTDLLPDGTEYAGDRPTYPTGRLPRGWVLDEIESRNWQVPILPGTLCIRRDIAIQANGWIAMPGTGDIGLVAAASELRDGYYIADPSILYRRHPEQLSIVEMVDDPQGQIDGRRFLQERCHALRDAGL